MKVWQLDYVETGHYSQYGLTLALGNQELTISLYAQNVIRLRYGLGGRHRPSASPDTGLPPVLAKEGVPLQADWAEISGGWEYHGGEFKICVSKNPFSLVIRDVAGKELLSQACPQAYGQIGTRVWTEWSWDGSPVTGLGEKPGSLDKRGKHWVLWNTDVVPHMPSTDPMYVSIPWLLSRRWGMFLNNTYRSEWDMGKKAPGRFTVQADGGEIDLWIFLGSNPREILTRWMERIGTMPLPPLWAIGHQQSRYSYHPQEQVIEIASTMREKHIPCDAVHLDIHYMDGHRDFTWDPREFPDPDKLTRELHELGFRVITIVDPGVKQDENYQVCASGLTQGMFCAKQTGEVFVGEVWPGPSLFPDFSRNSVRAWWGEQQSQHLARGVDGIWNDMNEPSVFNVPGKTFPPDVCHGEYGELSHAEIHNRYGSLMAQAAQEGLQQFAPNKRPFVLTRAGFAGIQRYAAVWLGDNSSWWEHLAQAVSMCLNMGLSGVAFVGTDIGGFMEDTEGELLARWAQLGAFTPFCRNHSNIDTLPQEPWACGAEVEEIYRQAMQLRYRLLPTLYTLFEESSRTGSPVMRALLLEYPEDETAWRINDEFLLGSRCLVAPVIQKGARERLVYLPEGIWMHHTTGVIYQGGQHIVVEAPLAEIPMFMREGAILALGCGGETATPALLDAQTLQVFAHAPFTTAVSFYADSGEDYDYRHGKYRRLNIKGEYDGNTLTLSAVQEGEWPQLKATTVQVYWQGKSTNYNWDLSTTLVCTE